jgi:hypothetical protein
MARRVKRSVQNASFRTHPIAWNADATHGVSPSPGAQAQGIFVTPNVYQGSRVVVSPRVTVIAVYSVGVPAQPEAGMNRCGTEP